MSPVAWRGTHENGLSKIQTMTTMMQLSSLLSECAKALQREMEENARLKAALAEVRLNAAEAHASAAKAHAVAGELKKSELQTNFKVTKLQHAANKAEEGEKEVQKKLIATLKKNKVMEDELMFKGKEVDRLRAHRNHLYKQLIRVKEVNTTPKKRKVSFSDNVLVKRIRHE